jgi:hypothetical protein
VLVVEEADVREVRHMFRFGDTNMMVEVFRTHRVMCPRRHKKVETLYTWTKQSGQGMKEHVDRRMTGMVRNQNEDAPPVERKVSDGGGANLLYLLI